MHSSDFFHDIECFSAENSNSSVTSELYTSFVCKHHGTPKPSAFFIICLDHFFRKFAVVFDGDLLCRNSAKTPCFFSIILTVVLDNDSLAEKELYFTRIFSRLVLGSFNTSLTNFFSVFSNNFGGRPVEWPTCRSPLSVRDVTAGKRPWLQFEINKLVLLNSQTLPTKQTLTKKRYNKQNLNTLKQKQKSTMIRTK